MRVGALRKELELVRWTTWILVPVAAFIAVICLRSVSTIYAPGYSWRKFSSIRNGMTSKEVTRILGQPLSIERFEGEIHWSHDGLRDVPTPVATAAGPTSSPASVGANFVADLSGKIIRGSLLRGGPQEGGGDRKIARRRQEALWCTADRLYDPWLPVELDPPYPPLSRTSTKLSWTDKSSFSAPEQISKLWPGQSSGSFGDSLDEEPNVILFGIEIKKIESQPIFPPKRTVANQASPEAAISDAIRVCSSSVPCQRAQATESWPPGRTSKPFRACPSSIARRMGNREAVGDDVISEIPEGLKKSYAFALQGFPEELNECIEVNTWIDFPGFQLLVDLDE